MITARPAPPPKRPTLTIADKGADVVLSVVDVDGWKVGLVLSPDMADEAARLLATAARRARKGAI